MSYKENDDALKELVRQVKKIVKHFISKAGFDKTYTGIVATVNDNGDTVKYNGTEITIRTTATDLYKKCDAVKFCIPCNNLRKAYLVVDADLMKQYIDRKFEELNK